MSPSAPDVTIARAESAAQFDAVRALLAEYLAWNSAEVRAQGLDVETFHAHWHGGKADELPGRFMPPDGRLLIANVDGRPAGCVGYQRLDAATCEMKRLFVRPEFRSLGVGRRLVEELIATAGTAGYRTMALETRTFMAGAVGLYLSLGFRVRGPYDEIPAGFGPVTLFMERELARGSAP